MKKYIDSISKMTLVAAGLVLAMLFFAMACNQGPPKKSLLAQAEKGKAHFQEHCAGCHGEDAKGLVLEDVEVQPPDLTMITANTEEGEFPTKEIVRIIEGSKRLDAHGATTMPIWGEVFATGENLDDVELAGKLGEIIAYIMSIQS